jgi:hypothetical protein
VTTNPQRMAPPARSQSGPSRSCSAHALALAQATVANPTPIPSTTATGHQPFESASSSRAATASPIIATASSSSWPASTPAKVLTGPSATAPSAATSSTPSRSSPTGSPTRQIPARKLRAARRDHHLLRPLHRRRNLHRSEHHPDHPALELSPPRQFTLVSRRRRRALDQPQISRLRRHHGTTSKTNGPNGDASVWNFTPQGGIGVALLSSRPDRSIDFSANGVPHLQSASLGDRNPGVNASVQFSLGYTWWK